MKVNFYKWNETSIEIKEKIFKRSETDITKDLETVRTILEEVKRRGDNALKELTLKLDKCDLSNLPIKITEDEFKTAEKTLSTELKKAIKRAIDNVRKFHLSQKPIVTPQVEVEPGIFAGERYTPIPSVGLYVPRGRGSFPSMLIMEAIPAVIAGVKIIAVVTPPDTDGKVDAATLYAAKECGITNIYRVGGAQAIAALAYGTETIPKVVKILGPGSKYVAAAKRLVYGIVDTGLPAGPSESVILADKTADPYRVALDLIIEAEHGADSSAILVTPEIPLAEKVREILPNLIEELREPRKSFVESVLSNYGGIIITENIKSATRFVNDFAPEHLQIASSEPHALLNMIENAGEILLGQNTPFTLANYATGPNAILPTGGHAKTYSPLSVYDFIKFSSVVYITREASVNLAREVVKLADYEGFQAHAMALKKRYKLE